MEGLEVCHLQFKVILKYKMHRIPKKSQVRSIFVDTEFVEVHIGRLQNTYAMHNYRKSRFYQEILLKQFAQSF